MLISDWSSDVCSSDLGFEPFWVVTKHADVLEVARRNDLYDSTTKPFILGEIEAIERMRAINDGDAFPFKSLTGTDEPEHGVLSSEEHTSELQSLMRISYAVFCLKKNIPHQANIHIIYYLTAYNDIN